MKKYFYMAVAAIAVLSSCDKANNIIDGGQENAVNAPVFTATINPGTKTTIAQNPETGNYTKVNWESGDEVAMIFFNQSGHVYSFPTYVATPSVADASTATLSIKAGETYNPEANQLADVLYPSSVLDRETNMLYFPATQVYKGDNKIGFAPMVFLNFSLYDKEHVIPVPENIQMQNACALLQITVPYSEMHEVRSITVSSDLQMNGAFSIDSGDDGMFVFDDPSDPDDGENQVTLDCYSYTKSNVTIPEGGSKTFYISIVARENVEDAPYFKYLNIDVTDGITTKTMRTKTFAGTKGDGIEIKPNVIYPFTFKDNQPLLAGKFSVSAKKQVQFTKGNLWCNTTTTPVTWALESNQTDYPTTRNTDHVGHFYWAKTAAAAYAASYDDGTNATTDHFFADGSDEAHMLTVSGTTGLYTLSLDEWNYLIGTRSNASDLIKHAVTVTNGGKSYDNCLIIAPDDFTGTLASSYTLKEVNNLGLVCLPSSGYYYNSSFNSGAGYCWSTTSTNAGYANYMFYSSKEVSTSNGSRNRGRGMRLVKKVE